MLETLKTVFKLDVYPDPVERRRALTLYWILALMTTFILVVLVLGTLEHSYDAGITTLLTGALLSQVFSIWLAREGHLERASWLAIMILFVATAAVNLTYAADAEGIRSDGIWIVLLIASLLVKPRIALGLVAAYVLVWIATFIIAGDATPTPVTAENLHSWQVFRVLTTIFFGGLIWFVSRNLQFVADTVRFEATNRELILSRTTAEVSHHIFTRLDLETLLSETVELIRKQFEDIYHAQVFLIDEERQLAVLRASTGIVGRALIEKKHALAVGSTSVIGSVTQSGKPVLVEDTATTGIHRVNELLPNTLTELAVPLRSSEGIIGALDVQSTRRNAFNKNDIEILQTLADQIAVAVENARLFEDAQDEAERARAMANASQIASRMTTDFEGSIQSLFETISSAGQYTRWWLGLVDADGNTLRCIAHQAETPETGTIPKVFYLDRDQNSLVDAYRTRQVIIENDIKISPHFDTVNTGIFTLFGRHIAAPVITAGTDKVAGVLLVGRSQDAAPLDQRDLELLATLTSQISVALETRRLFEQVQEEQQMLQAVLNTMPVSVVVVDQNSTIILVNEQAQIMLGEHIRAGNQVESINHIYQSGSADLYPIELIPLNQALSLRQVVSAEDLAILQPDGTRMDILARAAPILDARGEIYAVVSVYQDITELRELERALQESLSETTKLYEASRAVSHANSLDTLADAVTSQMLTLAPDRLYMTLINHTDSDNVEVSVLMSWPNRNITHLEDIDLPKNILIPDSGLGTTNLTFATRNLHLLPGIEAAELEKLKEKNVAALAVLPLEIRGQVFGSIIGVFQKERHFSPEERRFLLTLADQTAVSLDAVLSFERTQHTLQSISRLYQASRAIAEVQDVGEALGVVQQQVMVLIPDQIEVTLTADQDSGTLYPAMVWVPDDDDEPETIVPLESESHFSPLSREEFFIEDVPENSSALASYLQDIKSPFHAVASLPFRAAGQPTGRLTVGFKEKHIFSNEDQQFLRMLADSAAYVIENDILFRQTQDSLEETGILYQAIRAFSNAEDTEGILQAIIDYAADPLVDKALLCLLLTEDWDSPNALMEVAVSWVRSDSVDLTGMRFTSEQFPSWEQISTSDILWVNDVMQDPQLDDTARMGYRALDIASFAVVPLGMGNKAIGAILLGSSTPRTHTDREIRIYQSLADQAAITMENIRLLDEAERRARQLATSARVSQAASSILKINELLPEMVDLIKDAFSYDHVQVFLLNHEETDAILQASTGEAGRQLLAVRYSLPVGSRSVIGTVTATGKPSIALDTADARVIHKPNPYLPNTRSEMAIPLIAKNKILGALDVQSNQPGAFTEADVRVLSVLADQLAVAIENASLFEVSQQRSEEMSFLFTVTAESTSAGELEEILRRVSELLLQQMRADIVIPYLYDESTHSLKAGAVSAEIQDIPDSIYNPVTINENNLAMGPAISKLPILRRTITPPNDIPVLKGMKSGVYIPLITAERVIGVLALESTRPEQFDNSSLTLLQAFTGSLAAVIQNQRLLDDIRAANERLREIDKLKTNFLAAMSHELRTPLNSIIGFSRVILKGIDGPITETQQQDLQTIHDSGKHLLGLVNDILDQAKIEAGKMQLSLEYFDLTRVIDSVMSSAEGLTREKPIRLYTEIAPELPQAYGDEFRTRQVLFNLLSNAAKFTSKGSITTSAYIIEMDGTRMIQVSVTDTGMGIREEDFDKLFESFQQVDNSTTRSAEGTGLGLPLAKSLTELQGGTIRVESEFGVGSTFSVTIPIQPVTHVEPEAEPEKVEEVAASNGKTGPLADMTPRTILVVEDNVDMINFYRRHLSNDGYDVIGVINADDAMNKLSQIQPAAVIVNVNINNDRGWDILSQITEIEYMRQIPIIVSSLHEDMERSEPFGVARHLVRPFSPEDLLVAIQEAEENRISS